MTRPAAHAAALDADDWFVHAFGADYPLLYRHRDTDSARAEVTALMGRLALPGGARVLDVCCGAGRHMLTLADLGFDVWGLDLSPQLLAEAVAHEAIADRLVRADMRALPFGAVFDAALNLFTSFGYFQQDAENAGAMRQIIGTLKPGGRLVVDLIHRAHLEANLIAESEQQIEDMQLHARRAIVGNRVVKRTTVKKADDRREFVESVRLYGPDEITALLNACDVEQIELFGDFDGSPLTDRSPRMIVTGVRR